METELTGEQRNALLETWHTTGGSGWEAALAMADLARRFERENLAARGGTMTVGRLRRALADVEERCPASLVDPIRSHIFAQGARVETAQQEVAQMDAALRVTVPEMMARLTSACVWCGAEAETGLSPHALKEAVRAHVLTCPAHPLRAAERERDEATSKQEALRAELRSYFHVAVEAAQVIAGDSGMLGEGLVAGARRVVAERDAAQAEFAQLKPSGEAAEDLRNIRKKLPGGHFDGCSSERFDPDALCDCGAVPEVQAAQRLAAKAQGYEAMKAERDAAIERCKVEITKAIASESERDAAVADNAAMLERLKAAETESGKWRGLTLNLLVLNVLAIAQWERYVRASTEAQDLGCPGTGRCHGSMAWCPAHGDVKLLCDMEGKCDLHRERWTEWVLERAPVAKLAREEGMEAGLTKARGEARQQVEALQEKLRRARSDAWAEAVDVINGEPLASDAAREALAPVLGRIVPRQSHGRSAVVIGDGRLYYSQESRDVTEEKEAAVRPFLQLARDRLDRRSYEPIPLEACTRLLKAFITEDPHAQ